MEERRKDGRFEFNLRINNHIICQRFFGIYNFNRASLRSIELFDMTKECVKIIEDSMMVKTRENLWKYYNPYKQQEVVDEMSKRSIYEKIDNFQFELKVDDERVIMREFSGNPYPPKVRYDVNIREEVPAIIEAIRYWLTLDYYTKYKEVA